MIPRARKTPHTFPEPPPALVRALSHVVRRLPAFPPSAATAIAANLWLLGSRGSGQLAQAHGRTVRIVVLDAGLQLTFVVQPEGLVASRSNDADVTISANAREFIALATRREDPDTLFFSRRLSIEGDTALGHLLKNTLESLEASPRVPSPARVLRALRIQLLRVD